MERQQHIKCEEGDADLAGGQDLLRQVQSCDTTTFVLCHVMETMELVVWNLLLSCDPRGLQIEDLPNTY